MIYNEQTVNLVNEMIKTIETKYNIIVERWTYNKIRMEFSIFLAKGYKLPDNIITTKNVFKTFPFNVMIYEYRYLFPTQYDHLSDIEVSIEEWRLSSKLPWFHEEYLKRCDHCGVILNCINVPYDYSNSVMRDNLMGVLCNNCENIGIINQSPVSQKLNRMFIEEQMSKEFLVRIRNIDNLELEREI